MGKKAVDKTGEMNINNFGSKMIIKEYRKYSDIDIYFPEYDWTFEHARYNDFKNGEIKCPYEPRAYGKGYLGKGKYKIKENGKFKREFVIWVSMLQRCYDPKYKEKLIKEVIDSYKGKIPEPFYSKLRESMYNYKVEIND